MSLKSSGSALTTQNSRLRDTLREGIAASLVRAIILRAEIALKQNDRQTAETWTSAARALWGKGDPEPRARVAALAAQR